MKYSDQPIRRTKDDVLRRSKFSLTLAQTIDQLIPARDGFVIAITGEWGSGKSSVIELMLLYLTHIEMERSCQFLGPRFAQETMNTIDLMAEDYEAVKDRVLSFSGSNLDFSKTHYLRREELFRSWISDPNSADNAIKYWILLDSLQRSCRTIQIRFSPWLIADKSELATALISELARSIGESLGSEVRSAFASLLQRLSEFGPIAGSGLDILTGVPISKLFSTGLHCPRPQPLV